jgi:hypothetical protein
VHRYGWRAYALPVLAALTVVAVIQLAGSGDGAAAPGDPAAAAGGSVTVTVPTSVPTTVPTTVTVQKPGTTTTVEEQMTGSAQTGTALPSLAAADPNGTFKGIAAGALPPGAPFAKTGAGTFHIVKGAATTIGDGPDHRTFTIEVEDGIENAEHDKMFASAVMHILSDPRSWIGGGDFTLERINHGKPDFRITLTSQMTVRKAENCGWQIKLEASCYNRLDGRVFINDARWVRGAVVYNGDLASYRVYATNHEVGHALGFHHQPCPKTNGLAPVMMQQSWSTSDDDLAKLNPGGPVHADGKVCKVNPFPYPLGSADGSTTSEGSAASSTGSESAGG